MRVAHVNQDRGVSPGRKKGAAVHVAAMRQAFRKLGCEVVEVDLSGSDEVLSELEALHAERPIDLVYERYALKANGASIFARRSGAPLVLEVNAPLIWEEEHRRGGAAATQRAEEFERDVFAGAASILVVSTEVGAYVARCGVPRSRIVVHPNAVDHALFHPRADRELRLRIGIAQDAFVIGFHGRLREWHGFDQLARATAQLMSRGVAAHLLIVGSGDFERHLTDPRLQRASTIVGWVPHEEVGHYVACFDALPLTYARDEPCYFSPLKLLEAMACGAVPLVPDLGDLAQTVEFGRTGVLYRAGDYDALVRELEQLARDEERRVLLGAAAAHAARRRSWTGIAANVLETVGVARTR